MDDVQINSDPVKQKANNIKKMRILTLFDKDSAIAKRQEDEYELLTKKEDEEMQGIESVDQIVDQIQEEIINELQSKDENFLCYVKIKQEIKC